jgi:formyl-CoA transferase
VREGSQHRAIAPASIFPTSDGFVSLYVSWEHWPVFLSAWPDHPADLDEPSWRSNLTRRQHADRINALVTEFSRARTTTELVDTLQGVGIPCLPVNSPRSFMTDPHVEAREAFQPVEHPDRRPAPACQPAASSRGAHAIRPGRAAGS